MVKEITSDKPATLEQEFLQYLGFGEWFDRAVTRHLLRCDFDRESDCFFSFSSGCLEGLKALGNRGVVTICDQIDSARVGEEMLNEESLKWPGWQEMKGRIPEEYFQRLSAEWAAADLIAVNSKWSKQALIKQGVPAEKQFIVPVAYEPVLYKPPRRPAKGTLTVLWLGLVNLLKGIQYLVEAAKLLAAEDITFIVAGPIEITRDAIAVAPKNMKFIGRVDRSDVSTIYQDADVFVFPTLSDGFGLTQVEALGYGLPVVATPNCGEVVTHGVDGLIVPPRNPRSLADALLALRRDPKLLQEMSNNALTKARKFPLSVQAEIMDREVSRFIANGRRHMSPESNEFSQIGSRKGFGKG
jgi:glycosyltransferase involved in cell wall biosynthesis